jgi:hypothetical protein
MNLRTQLEAIRDKRGELTPALVVEEARPKNHPLHNRFEWNQSAAAEAWRRQQAHELIRSVKIVYREATENDTAKSVRAFHAVRRETGHVYETAEEIAEDEFSRALVLRDMEREWKQLHRRYSQFAEFVTLISGDLGLGEAS